MRRKIFDGVDLKIYWKKKAVEGGALVHCSDLSVEVGGKDISKSVKSVTIYFDADSAMNYEIQMYSVFEKIKRPWFQFDYHETGQCKQKHTTSRRMKSYW